MIDLEAIESAILSATEGEADSICAMALARLMNRTESDRGRWELERANEALSRARMLRHVPTAPVHRRHSTHLLRCVCGRSWAECRVRG